MKLKMILAMSLVWTGGATFSGWASPARETDVQRIENGAQVYQEILEEINKKDDAAPSPVFSSSPVAAPAQDENKTELQRFVNEIRFEIQESAEFPTQLKGHGLKATVVVEFQLNPDGTLKTVNVASNGLEAKPEFQSGAVNAVRRAVEFFPPVPRTVNADGVKFKVPIIFEDVSTET